MSSMMDSADWKLVGQVRTAADSLEFPSAGKAQGVYWYRITEGADEVAGYVGRTGRWNGLDGRFAEYQDRVHHPRDQRGNPVPPDSPDEALGTTSLNARRMLRALDADQTVSVSVLDGPELAGKKNPHRNEQEKHLIHELCRSDVEVVWNRKHVIGRDILGHRIVGRDVGRIMAGDFGEEALKRLCLAPCEEE